MDAIDLLRSQHQEMERLFVQVLQSPDDDRRKAAFSGLTERLIAHMIAEERIFYPAVKTPRTEEILLESLEQHLAIKRLLADLLDMEVSDRLFKAKFNVLKEHTEHHLRADEERLLPKAFKLLAPKQREDLGQQMLDLQRDLRIAGELGERVRRETAAAAPL
jgi:hypothetical protein